MFIQIQDTPNPHSLKFNPGIAVLDNGTKSFAEGEDISSSPLAQALFKIDGVKGVFFGQDFITVTKAPDNDWEYLKPILLAAIMDHFVAGFPVLNISENKSEKGTIAGDAITNQIVEIIETRVRPAVAQDGGDIIFKDFKDGIVYLELHGACAGCPSSTITLKNGIENMLKHYIPEVQSVESV
jgi:Fe-S cluster biogenesis protein NfuA